MICFQCGAEAGLSDFCPVCGADLSLFQRAFKLSNRYYNDGLKLAQERNLTAAVAVLRKSLQFNKYNISARNLLGLVYFELGEAVDALSEWVISKNYLPEENRAGDYLEMIRKNRGQLNNIRQTIQKYNQALSYCGQNSYDLAILQLRKVLQLNPRLVKGQQLMALLYMQQGRPDKAKQCLRNAAKVDTNNSLTIRYMKEANQQLREKGSRKKEKADEDLISYQSGNETIIMPKRFKETSLGSVLLNIVIGLAVGVAVTYFLIVPHVRKTAVDNARDQLLAANDTIASDKQQITSLQSQIDSLNEQIAGNTMDSDEYTATITSYEGLLEAYILYTQEDMLGAGKAMESVGKEYLNASARETYDRIDAEVTEKYIRELYDEGYQYFSNGEYKKAIKDLKKVTKQDMSYEEGKAAYYLAQSYRMIEKNESAQTYYQYVIDNYPDSELARTAENYVDSQ